MAGKTFSTGLGVFQNGRKIKIQEKGIIKFCSRLRGKKTNIFYNFLTIDNDQLLSGGLDLTT